MRKALVVLGLAALAGCGKVYEQIPLETQTRNPSEVGKNVSLYFRHSPKLADPVAVIRCKLAVAVDREERQKVELRWRAEKVGEVFTEWRVERRVEEKDCPFKVREVLKAGRPLAEEEYFATKDELTLDLARVVEPDEPSETLAFEIAYECTEPGTGFGGKELRARFSVGADRGRAIARVWPHLLALEKKPADTYSYYWAGKKCHDAGSPGTARVILGAGSVASPGAENVREALEEVAAKFRSAKGRSLEESRKRAGASEVLKAKLEELIRGLDEGAEKESKGDYRRAIATYGELVFEHPGEEVVNERLRSARVNWARALAAEGHHHHAIDKFAEAIEKGAGFDFSRTEAAASYMKLARVAKEAGLSGLCRSYWHRALLLKPSNEKVTRALALEAAAREDRTNALLFARRLQRLYPGKPTGFATEVEALAALGETEAAKASLRSFRKRFPQEGALASGLLAKIEAAEALAVREEPREEVLGLSKARELAEDGRLHEALGALEKLPASGPALFLKARCLVQLGKPVEAEPPGLGSLFRFEKALDRGEAASEEAARASQLVAGLYAAKIFAGQGTDVSKKRALAFARRALDHDPANNDAKRLIERLSGK